MHGCDLTSANKLCTLHHFPSSCSLPIQIAEERAHVPKRPSSCISVLAAGLERVHVCVSCKPYTIRPLEVTGIATQNMTQREYKLIILQHIGFLSGEPSLASLNNQTVIPILYFITEIKNATQEKVLTITQRTFDLHNSINVSP